MDRRDILQRVARGELSPEEADRLLGGSPETPAASSPLERIKVVTGFGAIVVVGDPGVAEAQVEGAHTASVEGDTLVVRSDVDVIAPGSFAFQLGGRRRGSSRRIVTHPHGALRVRMNPALALDAKIDAGPLSISGISGAIRARAAAGPITIEDADGTLDVSVNAGAVRVMGRITSGESRIRSDAGAVRVELDPDSSVRIIADAALGKVMVPGGEEPERRRFGSRREATIGSGEGLLRIETAMGSIHVTVRA